MNEFFDISILDELYEKRCEPFESFMLKNDLVINEVEEKIEKIIKDFLKDYPKESDIKNEMETENLLFELLILAETWNKYFYKLGVADGLNLKNGTAKLLEEKINGKING